MIRISLATLVMMGILTPWVVWASQQALSELFNAPVLWVAPSFEPRRHFDAFLAQFDRPETLVVSWEGCTVDDPRLPKLAAALMSDEPATADASYRDLFPNVFTGYQAVRGLMQEPLELTREQALRRLEGTLVGPDGETSCAIVVVSLQGSRMREDLLGLLFQRAHTAAGLEPDDLYLSGSLVEGVAIDAESLQSGLYAVPSALLSLLICLVCLRSPTLAAPIFAVALFGEGLVLAVAYALGIEMNAVLMVLAPLVFILTISTGIHLANYYRDEAAYHGVEGAVGRTVATGLRPCALAAMTTAVGLGSLAVSDVTPVGHFGWLGAAGVVTTVVLLFLVLPGVLAWRPPQVAPRHGETTTGPLHRLGVLIQRGWPGILAAAAALLLVGGWGLTHLRTSVSVLSLLDEDSRLVMDYRWLENHLGPLVPVELLVEFPPDAPLNDVQRLQIVMGLHGATSQIEGVGGTLSAATFLPPLPRAGGMRGTIRRTLYEKRLSEALPELEQAGYLAADEDGRQTWRITARTSALQNEDHARVLDALAEQNQKLLQSLADAQLPGVRIRTTGIMPMVQAGQELLLHDLIVSFLTAFLVVAAIMMVALRSIWAGTLAMLPNLFPVAVMFGVMGWLDVPVDIGTMMTASIALGIAVDDTLHFLIWYQRVRRQQLNANQAMMSALQHCGRAMFHTTVICSLGLMVYTLSDFVPTRRFAGMMFALLSAALLSDLMFLPALLVGPMRRGFGSRPRVPPPHAPQTTPASIVEA